MTNKRQWPIRSLPAHPVGCDAQRPRDRRAGNAAVHAGSMGSAPAGCRTAADLQHEIATVSHAATPESLHPWAGTGYRSTTDDTAAAILTLTQIGSGLQRPGDPPVRRGVCAGGGRDLRQLLRESRRESRQSVTSRSCGWGGGGRCGYTVASVVFGLVELGIGDLNEAFGRTA